MQARLFDHSRRLLVARGSHGVALRRSSPLIPGREFDTLPFVQRVLFAAGLEPATNSPSEMRRIIEADYKKWGQLIEASGLKAECSLPPLDPRAERL